jgi:hypothetical protein
MRLFKRRSLPPTPFGYQPPAEATARSWICADLGCGTTGDDPDPAAWPGRCPKCGGQVGTGRLDEPWQHAARRVEIDSRLAAPRWSSDAEAAASDDLVWAFDEALRSGDEAAVRRAEDALRTTPAPVFYGPGHHLWWLTEISLEHGDFPRVGRTLRYWSTLTSYARIATDSAARANARLLVEQLIVYFERMYDDGRPAQPDLFEALEEAADRLGDAMPDPSRAGLARLRQRRAKARSQAQSQSQAG